MLNVSVKQFKHGQPPPYGLEKKCLAPLESNRLLQFSPQRRLRHTSEFNPRAECSISQKHVGGKCSLKMLHVHYRTLVSERAGWKEGAAEVRSLQAHLEDPVGLAKSLPLSRSIKHIIKAPSCSALGPWI